MCLLFYIQMYIFELAGLLYHCSVFSKKLLTLFLQCTHLWNRVGFRQRTTAERASYPKTTSPMCDRHDDVITPSLYNTKI